MTLNPWMHPRNLYKSKKPDFAHLALKYPELRPHCTLLPSRKVRLTVGNGRISWFSGHTANQGCENERFLVKFQPISINFTKFSSILVKNWSDFYTFGQIFADVGEIFVRY